MKLIAGEMYWPGFFPSPLAGTIVQDKLYCQVEPDLQFSIHLPPLHPLLFTLHDCTPCHCRENLRFSRQSTGLLRCARNDMKLTVTPANPKDLAPLPNPLPKGARGSETYRSAVILRAEARRISFLYSFKDSSPPNGYRAQNDVAHWA